MTISLFIEPVHQVNRNNEIIMYIVDVPLTPMAWSLVCVYYMHVKNKLITVVQCIIAIVISNSNSDFI